MRYLVIINNEPFYTDWLFELEGDYIIIDLLNEYYTTDGVNWDEIKHDSL